jgi:uncharacterized coiled-coil protein SlyX
MHVGRSKTPRIDALEDTLRHQQQVIEVLTSRLGRLEIRVHEFDHKGVSGAMGNI